MAKKNKISNAWIAAGAAVLALVLFKKKDSATATKTKPYERASSDHAREEYTKEVTAEQNITKDIQDGGFEEIRNPYSPKPRFE